MGVPQVRGVRNTKRRHGVVLMDKQTAEVFFWMAEFISDRSQWFTLCKYLEERGVLPDQIATAYNKAAESSGHSARLAPQDCE